MTARRGVPSGEDVAAAWAKPFGDASQSNGSDPAGKVKPKLHAIDVGGFAMLAGGLIGWIWLDKWEWAASGLVLAVLAFIVAASIKPTIS